MPSLFNDSGFFLNLFNAIPIPLFVVDKDVVILHCNDAASGIISDRNSYKKRGGDVLHCMNAIKQPDGCGHAAECRECIIRNSVQEAFQNSRVYRKKMALTLMTDIGSRDIHLLVTASPFIFEEISYVMLILEDISELLHLRGLIPICAWCKKIRNDENYWQSLEEYFGKYHDIAFSHGICEECYKKHYGGARP